VLEFLRDNQGVLGAVVGFVVSQIVQAWRDGEAEKRAIAAERRADARARRNAKLDRIRGACETVLAAAWGLQTARLEHVHGFAGESEDEKTARINTIIDESMKGVNQANVRLALEPDMGDVREKFREVYLGYKMYVDAFRAKRNEVDPAQRAAFLETDRKRVEDGTAALEQLLPQRLADIETSA
jgi:hypothetical protein